MLNSSLVLPPATKYKMKNLKQINNRFCHERVIQASINEYSPRPSHFIFQFLIRSENCGFGGLHSLMLDVDSMKLAQTLCSLTPGPGPLTIGFSGRRLALFVAGGGDQHDYQNCRSIILNISKSKPYIFTLLP